MKHNKFLSAVYVLTFFCVLIGSTFAYFTTSSQSNSGAIASKSARVGINLLVEPLYADKPLIPMNNKDVMKAYAQNCIDDNDNGACRTYTITLKNIGEALDYKGTVNFSLNNIKNLNYLILDENDDVYVDIQKIEAGTEQSLGPTIDLNENESKVFKLIIWVPNFDYIQDDFDSNGSFNAKITYKSSNNNQISGSISGN